MMISANFDCLVTFDCVYGEWIHEYGVSRVYVEKGLVIKRSVFINDEEGARIVECASDELPRGESAFPVHYIYDPVKDAEYTSWKVLNGFLFAISNDGRVVEYRSKTERSYAMHEYVGGCWFVFSGVTFAKRVVDEYASDRKSSSGKKTSDEIGCRTTLDSLTHEYVLEGVTNASPGPGWMSLVIHAESFFIEIPGK
jgi:hypothetical protein